MTPGCVMLAVLAAAAPERTAFLSLFVNDTAAGEVMVVLTEDDAYVVAADLARAGLRHLEGRSESFRGKAMLSLASLSPELRYTIDEEELALHVRAAPELFEVSHVDLGARTPERLVHHQDTSAFFNYAPRVVDGKTFEASSELGVSFLGALVQSAASYDATRGVVRGLSNLVVDDRARLERWTLGDSFAGAGALGGALYLGGVTFAKTFELDPYFVRTPSIEYGGTVTTPSTVDVYVNDVLVRRESLPAGPFRLMNVPAQGGNGVTRYVIRDAFGGTQEITAGYYLAETALAPGVADYSYSLGARREDFGTTSFDYSKPVFLGRHRMGLTSAITCGGRLEASLGLLSGGAVLTLVTPIGQVDASLGASTSASGAGLASSVGFSTRGRRLGGSALVRVLSDRYATLSLGAEDDRSVVEGIAAVSYAAGAFTATAQAGAGRSRDHGVTARVVGTGSVELIPALRFGVSGGFASPGGVEVFAALSYTFLETMSASLSESVAVDPATREARQVLVAAASRPLPSGTGLGFMANASLAQDAPRADVTGMGQTSFGRYQATYQHLDGGDHVTLEAAGSVVFLDGAGLFFARPVQQGFAVLRTSEGVRGLLNEHEIGKTDEDGTLFIPDLVPYYANRLSISDVDLPMDEAVAEVEQLVAPPYRGGALVDLSTRVARFFRGRLVVVLAEEEVVPAFGEIAVEGAASPIGRDGTFELEGLAPGTHAAVITHARGRCRVELVVPRSARPVHDLGEIRCAP